MKLNLIFFPLVMFIALATNIENANAQLPDTTDLMIERMLMEDWWESGGIHPDAFEENWEWFLFEEYGIGNYSNPLDPVPGGEIGEYELPFPYPGNVG